MSKKIILTLGILVFLIISVKLVSNSSEKNIENSNNKSKIKTISTHVDYTRNFGLDDLTSEALIIVNGKTIDQSYFDMDGQTYTKSTIQIDKVYKGNVKKDTSIEIIEFGGITEENPVSEIEDKTGTKLSESEKAKYKKTKVKILVGGVSTSQKSEQSVFFLEKVPMSIIQKAKINQEAYTPLGSTQGRLTVKNNTFQRYSEGSLAEIKTTDDVLIKKLKK